MVSVIVGFSDASEVISGRFAGFFAPLRPRRQKLTTRIVFRAAAISPVIHARRPVQDAPAIALNPDRAFIFIIRLFAAIAQTCGSIGLIVFRHISSVLRCLTWGPHQMRPVVRVTHTEPRAHRETLGTDQFPRIVAARRDFRPKRPLDFQHVFKQRVSHTEAAFIHLALERVQMVSEPRQA